MSGLKDYIITLKDSATDADVSSVKDKISSIGGSIVNEFSLIKGFTAKLPEVHSSAIGEHEHVASIEEDGEVKTQPI
ncbi:protease B inhibitor 2 [[Candida] railenensis]|uniref:Protease B inhibitor 2 n=1 Tax=[Candida] railenensis TaxID=45579 RepID=A0A9P0QVQ8_9ASCO|nr:protease B inhibitor 2 [[Candida] railenensis]